MAVHFILGGSGRGKSYYLNHIVAARAQEEKDKTFIMLVPEQATMQVQREIVQISSNRGIMNIEVQSFVRLAYRIFGETGTASLPVLDDMGNPSQGPSGEGKGVTLLWKECPQKGICCAD